MNRVTTLLDAQRGCWVHIVGFTGGEGLTAKLRQLGLMPGTRVRVLRTAPLGGPVLVEVGSRSVALGRRIAARINVACADSGADSGEGGD